MLSFIEKFMVSGFVHGDYTYGLVHIGSIALMVASIPILILYYQGKPKERVERDFRILAWVTIFFYILRRGVEVYEGKPFLEAFWPFYLCNVNTIFLSIYLIFDFKKGKAFFCLLFLKASLMISI